MTNYSDEIWVIISVEVAGTLAITQQMSNFNQLGKELRTVCIKLKSLGLSGRSGDNHQHNPFRTGQGESFEAQMD